MPKSLYFAAIIPPSPVLEQVQEKRLYFKDKYGSSHALKSPPHITLLAPFNTQEEKEKEIKSLFDEIAVSQTPFEVELRNYSSFSTKVIYIDVIQNEALSKIQLKLEEAARMNNELFNYNYEKRPFHPHMTLAFRDLSKENFRKAWEKFHDATFKATFKADSYSLLKHNGEKWEVVETFAFSE